MDEDYMPLGHAENLAFAREVAQWNLGDPDWADMILEAYFEGIGDTGEDRSESLAQ